MLGIKLFRENPEKIKENLRKRFQEHKISVVDEIINKDSKIKAFIIETEKLRHKRNQISKCISELKEKGKNYKELVIEAKEIPDKIKEIECKLEELKKELILLQMKIPNLIHDSVPIGRNEKENFPVEYIGKPKEMGFEVKSHVEIAETLDLVDFDASSKTSGKGFYFLKGKLALLNMALINFARDYMIKQDFLYVEPPLIIQKKILEGVYSNSEIKQMAYELEDNKFLIATSEHPLIGSFINKLIEEKELPIKLTGYSVCFRKEIGSHGIDERGLYRTHQFNKQEMVVLCKPEDSYKYYEEMLNHSKEIFKKLEIPTRVLECCSGDLGDLKAKSADLEAWSPRKKEYFEVCSCSNLTDAQSRRLKIRIKGKKENYFVHTLNNTAIATSRAMVAILENHQTKEGTINIPKVLVPYMNGTKIIEKTQTT